MAEGTKAGTFTPHTSSSLQMIGRGACWHPRAPFTRPDVCERALSRGVTRSERQEGGNGNGDGNGGGGGGGERDGERDGDGDRDKV